MFWWLFTPSKLGMAWPSQSRQERAHTRRPTGTTGVGGRTFKALAAQGTWICHCWSSVGRRATPRDPRWSRWSHAASVSGFHTCRGLAGSRVDRCMSHLRPNHRHPHNLAGHPYPPSTTKTAWNTSTSTPNSIPFRHSCELPLQSRYYALIRPFCILKILSRCSLYRCEAKLASISMFLWGSSHAQLPGGSRILEKSVSFWRKLQIALWW